MFMEFSRQEYCSGLPFPTPGYLPNPGLEPKSPALQADSFPPETPGKPKQSLWNSPGKNIGVGIHSLLQEIFPTQGLIPRLSHCRQILYHLSHQGVYKSQTELSTCTTARCNVHNLSQLDVNANDFLILDLK